MTRATATTCVHPSAVVHPDARLGEGVVIGPYTQVGGHVTIGRGTRIAGHCVIDGHTTIGEDNQIFSGAVVGTIPQDMKYAGEDSRLEIGDRNRIREYVTVNIGTAGGGGVTRLGNGNLLMAYAHVAHDCIIQNQVIIANNGTLAGHITIEDRAIIGGLSAVHQFVRVGTLAIVGGCSKVVQDVPPYAMCDGHPARIFGLNAEGLRRWKVSPPVRQRLKGAYRVLLRSGLSVQEALARLERECGDCDEVRQLVGFVRASKRGIAR